jgi:hypothetical protein
MIFTAKIELDNGSGDGIISPEQLLDILKKSFSDVPPEWFNSEGYTYRSVHNGDGDLIGEWETES